jgi:hypothetical protein
MNESTSNQAAGATASGTTSSRAEDVTSRIREIFDNFRLPGVDFDAFIASRQADIDAMTQATKSAFAGAQTISEKQAELLKNALGELSNAVKVRSGAEGTGEKIADITKQEAELMQNTLQKTLQGMKEMAEAVQQSQTEIYELALGRVRSNAEQLRSMFIRDQS